MKEIGLHTVHGTEADEMFGLRGPRDLFSQRVPTIDGGDPLEKAEEIRHYINSTMELYEKVFDCLASEEAYFVKPVHKLRHPMIFYYGHTASFYINKLCAAGLTSRINPSFEEMFAIGVDEMSWDDLNEEHYNWPTVQEVREYRLQVRHRVNEMIKSQKHKLSMPLTLGNSTENDENAFWWVMLMGAEHERIHIETASVHVRELPMEYIRQSMSEFWKRCPHTSATAPTNSMVSVAGGRVQVGRPPNSNQYGWDVDYSDGNNYVEVAPFKASKYIVSNAEFFAFMKEDGYNTERFWDEEGWSWVQWKKPTHPWFWVKDESRPDGYALRLQTELIDLPWDWPCELNNLEASAFCRFRSEKTGVYTRMLTESEWYLLHDRYVVQDMPQWGPTCPGNINLEIFKSSSPVNMFRHGDFYCIIGNVWQHCETPVYPLPGFRVQPFYDDFSLPTFDGRHTCMKGGAWISTGNEATRDARFAFRRHFFQYIGLRYVEGEKVNEQLRLRNALGLDPEMDRICDLSFRKEFAGVENGCVKIAQYANTVFSKFAKVEPKRAMDIACGAGRVSFELTSAFQEVIGVDYTARRLVPAFAIRERGDCAYSVPTRPKAERRAVTVQSADFPWGSTRERATFFQADPTNLHAHLKDFSLIVCWNCLERSYRPSAIPAHLMGRLEKGGIIVIGGDYNWDNIKSHVAVQDDELNNNTYPHRLPYLRQRQLGCDDP
ncbi:methyltransferase [Angomonas deanei]|nr:methyltransferase [Angomonas deanei]|eukprot:EPY36412.1 methyltransferase [Angomonas deanei]